MFRDSARLCRLRRGNSRRLASECGRRARRCERQRRPNSHLAACASGRPALVRRLRGSRAPAAAAITINATADGARSDCAHVHRPARSRAPASPAATRSPAARSDARAQLAAARRTASTSVPWRSSPTSDPPTAAPGRRNRRQHAAAAAAATASHDASDFGAAARKRTALR